MSAQTVIICDRCKDEIEEGKERTVVSSTKTELDFCRKCHAEFAAFLQGATVLSKEVPPEPEEDDPWDLDDVCPVHGTKRGRIEIHDQYYIPEPNCTCDILYPDTCRECLGRKGRHRMDCSQVRQSPSALDSITTAQWRAIADQNQPLVDEVVEARRMRKRLERLIEARDALTGVYKSMLSTSELRHAISGDLEAADAASPE